MQIKCQSRFEGPRFGPKSPTATPTFDAKTYFDIETTFYDRKEYDKAISDFTEAIRLDPNYAAAYYNRGLAYYFNSSWGTFDKAISDHSEAIRLDPNSCIPYSSRGIAYTEQGKSNKAEADLATAKRLVARPVKSLHFHGGAPASHGHAAGVRQDRCRVPMKTK
jgi:tetratricopeptide (TPR) repeat protein